MEDDLENGKYYLSSLEILAKNIVLILAKPMASPHVLVNIRINTNFPCKHFFLIFQYKEKWKWDSLPKCYFNSPYLSADISLSEVLLELPAEENIKDDVPGETKLKLSTPTVDDVQ